jgi:hypothetical protein
MKNYLLKSREDFLELTKKLEVQKVALSNLQRDTEEFKKKLKKFIDLTLFVKAHSYCLDNESERKKTTDIIFTSLIEINFLS